MHLTLHSDYAMRVLISLGIAPGRRSTIGEIATRHGISRNHLLKVCHRLQQLGYVEGIRGKGGGLRLVREPATIRIGEVFRATEPHLELVECFGRDNECRITRACGLPPMLADALAAFFDSLNQHTLADVLAAGPKLAGLLEVVVSPPRPRRAAER